MKKNAMKTIIRQTVSVLLLLVLLFNIIGCARQSDEETLITDTVKSFYDIPGITPEEITAIENIISNRQSFTIGSLNSLDAFYTDDGTAAGFIPLFSELLSDLFGVTFESQVYQWRELIGEFRAGTIDFTSSLNMFADMECFAVHTSPVAGNQLSVFTLKGAGDIVSERDMRGYNIGFYENSHTEGVLQRTFPELEYTAVAIATTGDMAGKLLSGEIDVFITDTADVFEFYQYDFIERVKTFPDIYIPATVATANPELAPIISAITKYLIAGGNIEAGRLYEIGERDYAAYAIHQTLSDEERAYIEWLRATGTRIPYGATNNRYPVAFYDYENNEFAGIALDVLDKISELTGIEFYPNCDENTTWGELEEMLKEGEIKILSQLIPNEPRKEYAIWPDTPYFTARYAMLSNVDFPFLSIDQVPYVTVGVSKNTAEETKFNEWFPDSANLVTFSAIPGTTGTDLGLDALERGEIDLFFSLDYTMLYESNYRENPNQKINILFDSPVEPVPFGININEEILCSIISKSQRIINTDRIARSWTSRIVDQSAKIEAERSRTYMIFSLSLLVMFSVLLAFFIRSQRLKKSVELQVEATLEASRNMQVLIDLAPVGIIISKCGDGELLYANHSALDIYKYDSFDNDVKGKKSIEFMPEKQSSGIRSIEIIEKMWKSDEGTEELEFIKKTGEVFVARVVYRTISYYGTLASLSILVDMTAEKEHRLMLENIALKEQEANQLKSRFLATMSHEIRTPMNAIIGMAELALREQDEGSVIDHVITIKQAGDNLLSILNDILDFSKIEAGKMDISETEYNVASMLNDLVSIIRMRLVDSQVEFAVIADSNIPKTLYGDETRVRQVVLNLLNNAAKYTETGYISFGAYCEFSDDNNIVLVLEVKDTGIGIKKEDIEILFDEFTQLRLELDKSVEGIGLGLAITRSIVENMGGKIYVQSEYGKGSTFTAKIPQKYNTNEEMAVVDFPENKKVIVYRESEIISRAMEFTLSNLGVEFVLVNDGDELRACMEKEVCDYLFLTYKTYTANEETINRFGKDTEIAILTQFGENNSFGGKMLEKNISVLTMPVYCTAVADVLNGVSGTITYTSDGEAIARFSAPDAKILIVDDISSNLKVAEGLLKPYGMRVDLANSGAAAIELIKKVAKEDTSEDGSGFYDVIFMDHKMPVMDGVEAVKNIRAMGGVFKKVPIIALTANAISGIADMFIDNGFNDFISKPIDTVRLNSILEKWIPKEKKK